MASDVLTTVVNRLPGGPASDGYVDLTNGNGFIQFTQDGSTPSTIIFGIWESTVIDPQYGGTGVNNTGTITVAGDTSFVGSTYSFIGNLTGDTDVTFPTSGTLATTSQTFPIPTLNNQLLVSNTGDTPEAVWTSYFFEDASNGNLSIGTGTSTSDGTNSQTLIGVNCGASMTDGDFNTAMGTGAMSNETNGDYNSAFGCSALGNMRGGSYNSAFGYSAAASVSNSTNNSAFGNQSLHAETTGTDNSAFGSGALLSQNGAVFNSAFGSASALQLTSGQYNSSFGGSSLQNETSGSNNAAFGYNALVSQNGSSSNSAFGYNSGGSLSTGNQNCSFGSSSLLSEQTGSFNCAFGYSALQSQDGLFGSSAFGYGAGAALVSGDGLSAFGYEALNAEATGAGNSAFGASSLAIQNGASHNTAFGGGTGAALATGSNNSIFGFQSLASENTGGNNSAFGYQALKLQSSSSGNTAFGYLAGSTKTSYTNCTFIGTSADASAGSITNATAIGAGTIVGQSYAVILGYDGVNTYNVGIGTSTPNTSAILDLTSTTGALLLPRMSDTERNSLTPAGGMVIFDTTTSEMEFYNGSTWINTGGGSGGTWVDQTSGSVTLAPGLSYLIDNGAGLVTLTLPTSAKLGDTYEIAGYSAGGWKVAQNALQSIQFSSSGTTAGVTGYAASGNQYDRILITYAANNTFLGVVLASTGAIIIN